MDNKRKQICLNYLEARKEFLSLADIDDVLQGNDNIIGRIGEAIAHSYLNQKSRNPIVVTHKSQAGYDILCDSGRTQVSVKMITSENKNRQSSKIKEPWDELIVIELGEDFKVKRLGIVLKQAFLNAIKENPKRNSLTPVCTLRMLDKDGLIGLNGKVLNSKQLEQFDLL